MDQYCNDFLRRRDSLTRSCELRHEDDDEQTHEIQNIHWGDRDSGPDCHALQAPVCKLVRSVGEVTANKERNVCNFCVKCNVKEMCPLTRCGVGKMAKNGRHHGDRQASGHEVFRS